MPSFQLSSQIGIALVVIVFVVSCLCIYQNQNGTVWWTPDTSHVPLTHRCPHVWQWVKSGMGEEKACLELLEQGKRKVEALVREGKAPIMFKHTHKAGGTTLCLTASKNMKTDITTFALGEHTWDTNCVPPALFYLGGACAIAKLDQAGQEKHLIKKYPGYFLASEGPLPTDMLILPSGRMPIAWVTILRHPYARTYSDFKFYQELVAKGKAIRRITICQRFAAPPGCDFLTWLWYYPDNWMTRTFAGNKVFASDEPIGEREFEMAKRRLHLFSIVLLLEDYNDGMEMFTTRFGWKEIDVDKHRKGSNNVNKSVAEIFRAQPRVLKTLEEKNVYDLKLYEYAQQLASAQQSGSR